MSVSHRGAGISIPSIYLKSLGLKEEPPKRVLFPKSFDSLMKTANQLFKDQFTVNSLYTDKYQLITSLDSIVPNSTIYVSSKKPDESKLSSQIQGTKNPSSKKTDDKPMKAKLNKYFTANQGEITEASNKMIELDDDYDTQPTFAPPKKAETDDRSDDAQRSENGSESGANRRTVSSKNSKKKVAKTKKGKKAKSKKLKKNEFVDEEKYDDKLPNKLLLEVVSNQNRRSARKALEGLPADLFEDVEIQELIASSQAASESQRSEQAPKSNEQEIIPEPEPELDESLCYSDDDDILGNQEEEDIAKETQEEEEELPDFNDDSIRAIFQELFENDSFSTKIRPSMEDKFSGDKLDLLQNGQAYEDCHRNWWFLTGMKYLSSHNFKECGNYLQGYNDIVKLCRSVIANHRVVKKGGIRYNMRVAIKGPRNSGKSTLLSMFTQELFIDISVNSLWKTYFFIFLDIKQISGYFGDVDTIYTKIIEHTFDSLSWQATRYFSYLQALKRYFLSLPDFREAPKLKKIFPDTIQFKQFVSKIELIARRICELFHNEDSRFDKWIVNLFEFPKQIADAAGFSHYFYIFDNADYANVTISPQTPFEITTQKIRFAKVLKAVLATTNYIVSCENEVNFCKLYGKMVDTDMISTTFINMEPPFPDQSFSVEFDGIVESLNIQATYFGGIPAYLSLWEELNTLADEYDEMTDEAEMEDQTSFIVHSAQQLVNQTLIDSESKKPLKVISAKRTSKSNNTTTTS